MKLFHKLIRKIPFNERKYLRRFFYKLINFGFNYRPEEGLNSLRQKIKLYFFLNPSSIIPYTNEVNFLKKKSLTAFSYSFIFPYNFVFDYDYEKVTVYRDISKDLFYVMHNGKRLYYNKSFKTKQDVQVGYYCINIEQDKNSPHKYIGDSYKIERNDVVVDVGAAEGNFALDHIEEIKHLYIFEANPEWEEALEATYEPWKEKVSIFNKFVSDNNAGGTITLDSILGDKIVNCIKIDVEGAEKSILEGSNLVLNNTNICLFICTYHQQDDAERIEKILQNRNFICSFSNGYMLFTLRELKPPYFRRGLLRAKK